MREGFFYRFFNEEAWEARDFSTLKSIVDVVCNISILKSIVDVVCNISILKSIADVVCNISILKSIAGVVCDILLKSSERLKENELHRDFGKIGG